MKALADEAQAAHLSRFFKTGPGEYGEGDRFLGIRAPVTRSIVKEYRRQVDLEDVSQLIASPWHEIRLAGFLLLVELYAAARRSERTRRQHPAYGSCREIVDFYLASLERGNNWDLVDMVAPKILGDYLLSRPEERSLLHQLAEMEGQLWHQRVAMVATWALIRDHEYDDALRLAARFLTHPHDLMHKASGWMLREIGKRGGSDLLTGFLDRHAAHMPRTMLRYSIEQLPEPRRQHYLRLKVEQYNRPKL